MRKLLIHTLTYQRVNDHLLNETLTVTLVLSKAELAFFISAYKTTKIIMYDCIFPWSSRHSLGCSGVYVSMEDTRQLV